MCFFKFFGKFWDHLYLQILKDQGMSLQIYYLLNFHNVVLLILLHTFKQILVAGTYLNSLSPGSLHVVTLVLEARSA